MRWRVAVTAMGTSQSLCMASARRSALSLRRILPPTILVTATASVATAHPPNLRDFAQVCFLLLCLLELADRLVEVAHGLSVCLFQPLSRPG